MNIPFYKFDGAGNDFVVVDNRKGDVRLSESEVARICHRRFGVGADGLMLLESAAGEYDFKMVYYNSDGRVGSMCGNGGRCITAFAHLLSIGRNSTHYRFLGYDGPHDAEVLMWDGHVGIVRLGMRSVKRSEVERVLDGWKVDTGSPHYVQRVQDLEHYDVVGEGRRIRNMADVFPQGVNVDFVEDLDDGRLMVRTYERGVEDETWACGTGVTACAIVSGNHRLVTRGGDFRVDFTPTGEAYDGVMLTGPVSLDYKGEWPIIQNQ